MRSDGEQREQETQNRSKYATAPPLPEHHTGGCRNQRERRYNRAAQMKLSAGHKPGSERERGGENS